MTNKDGAAWRPTINRFMRNNVTKTRRQVREERRRVTRGRILQELLAQDEHGDLGQVIAGDEIHRAALDHLQKRARAIAEKT